jgi:micrococcal nuclease
MMTSFQKILISVVVLHLVGCSIYQKPAVNTCQHTETALNCVKVVEVYDGDTIYIDLPEAPPPFSKRMPVRLAYIDAPEIKSKNECEKIKAQEAKQLTEAIIKAAERIDILNVQRDKHFRIDGEVLADGKSVGEEILKAKLAYPYNAEEDKSSIDWCNY